MKPSAFNGFPREAHPGYGPYPVFVDRWLDADTVVVCADCGLDAYQYVGIRLYNVDAPEMNTTVGRELQTAVSERWPPGTQMLLHTGAYERMSFTRYIGALEGTDGTDINAAINAMIEERM